MVFSQVGDWAAVYDLTMSRVMCMAYMVGVIYGVCCIYSMSGYGIMIFKLIHAVS